MGSTEDNCFVCGSDHGNLILCDFPGCVKVYHQVKLITIVTTPFYLFFIFFRCALYEFVTYR